MSDALGERVARLEALLAAGLPLQPGDYPVVMVSEGGIEYEETLRILPWNTEEPDTWTCPVCREERASGQCECGYVRTDVEGPK